MERENIKKPNSSLNPEEREAKRKLKKRLRVQAKVNKLEKRIRHAISRKDPVVEQRAREDLRLLLEENGIAESVGGRNGDAATRTSQGEKDGGSKAPLDGSSSSGCDASPDEAAAQKLVLSVCDALFARADRDCEQEIGTKADQKRSAEDGKAPPADGDGGSDRPRRKREKDAGGFGGSRAEQTERAVELLRHMTKGTQSGSMFRDRRALWGYARQKFHERAMLLYRSLRRIGPDAPVPDGCEGATAGQARVREEAWTALLRVRSACSLGCGPGNDAVGLLSFLSVHGSGGGSGRSRPDVALLDCFIEEWGPILAHLRSVLDGKYLLGTVRTGTCDVTKPFDYKSMSLAASLPSQGGAGDEKEGSNHSGDNGSAPRVPTPLPYDMFLFSYLLSETRGKWDSFVVGLVGAANPGSMFYFAEPVPWQLHRLVALCGDSLDYLWLDSSMHYPSLQPLDGRVGPAVLFARKR